MKELFLYSSFKPFRQIAYFDNSQSVSRSYISSSEKIKALAQETKRLLEVERHQKELIQNHGNNGHKVVQVLHHVENHGHKVKTSNEETPHVVFSLSQEQLKILQASKRWKTLKKIFDITHDVIESEVEHVIKFQFS